MKKVWGRWIMIAIASASLSLFDSTSSFGQGSVSMQVFYDELQPYGTWMNHGRYGYVWMPRVDAGFTPYGTNGYWVNTTYGNTWVSDYSWGWAPFHYGRWFYDDFHGWMWLPDTEWAPAWVAWRSGGGYYGWAPLMPGNGISVSMNYYNDIPYSYWNFVPHRYIMYRHVYTHCVPRPQVVNVIHHTTVVTHNYRDDRNRTYFTGPSRSEIERRNHERVPEYKINDRSRPGRTEVDRGSVSFYKPEVEKSRAIPTNAIRDDRRDNTAPMETRRERSSMNSAPTQRNTERSVPQYRESGVTRERELNAERQNSDMFDRQRAIQQQRERQNYEAIEQQRQNTLRREQQNFERRQQTPSFERQQGAQRSEETFRRSEPSRTYTAPRQQEQRQYNPAQQRQQQLPARQNNSPAQQVERGQQFNRSTMENRSSQPRQGESRSNVRKRTE